MLIVIRCSNQRFVFKNSGISCLVLIFNLSNLGTAISLLLNRSSHMQFFSSR